MAVTAAQLGRHSRCVAFKQGTSGQRAGKQMLPPNERSPICSFDRHNNLIRTHHVQTRARSSLNSAWISAQTLDLGAQVLVGIA